MSARRAHDEKNSVLFDERRGMLCGNSPTLLTVPVEPVNGERAQTLNESVSTKIKFAVEGTMGARKHYKSNVIRYFAAAE